MGAEWGVLPCNRLLSAAHYTELSGPRSPAGHVGEGGDIYSWGKLTTTRSWLSARRKTPFLLLHHLDITLAYSSANVLGREICTATIFGYMSAPSFLPSQAVDLSLKFVPERSVDVVALVSDRLANMGRYVQVRSL